MATSKKSVLKLPKLKIRDELLKTAPELGRYLAEDADGQQRAHSAYKRGGGSPGPGSPSRLHFLDAEVTEEEQLRVELEHVKQERASLMGSIAKLRLDQGKSGGELQQEDIRILRREIEAKKDKLNELTKEARRLMDLLEQLELTSHECQQLMPQSMADAEARMAQLTEELARVENDILEAEAKNELYKLLEIRTRRDHQASEQQQRESRQLKEDAMDDFTTLTKHMHEMRAAKEDAERELGMVVSMFDQVRSDWQKKLKNRRKEVNDMEKRKAEDRQRQEQQHALQEEKERIERSKAAKAKQEIEVQEARASKVMPQLEAMEVQWSRLHAITGAESPDDVISHWTDLKQKECNMKELVKLAEVRESRAKEQMSRLLEARAEVYHGSAPGEGSDGGDTAVQTAEAILAEGSSHVYDEKAQAIADATRRKQTAKKKFNKMSNVCVAAEQGLHLLLGRLRAAVSSAPLIMAEAADRRASAAGGRRTTRRMSSVRRITASQFMESRRSSMVGTTLVPPPWRETTSYQPVGSTIHERDFFPGLPSLVQEVGDRLDKVLAMAAQLEAISKSIDGSSQGAELNSDSSELGPDGSSRPRGTRTPRARWVGEVEEEGDLVPHNTEAALRRGFRRETLAGPPWLEAVANRGPQPGSPKKLLTGKLTARPAAQPNLQRIVGYAEDPQDSSDEDPFNLDSSEDEDAVLDREMLKMRAHKLCMARQRKPGSGSDGAGPAAHLVS